MSRGVWTGFTFHPKHSGAIAGKLKEEDAGSKHRGQLGGEGGGGGDEEGVGGSGGGALETMF